MATLVDKILALHGSFTHASVPHAFGGALALAFCTAEPRATKDIDVNVFVGPDHTDRMIATLPAEVAVSDTARIRLERDGQARLHWDDTPVDIFLSNHPFHDRAEANRRTVPFAGVSLSVLACEDLAVFKAFFARPKDVVDLASMAIAGCVVIEELEAEVATLMDDREERADFFERVISAVEQMS